MRDGGGQGFFSFLRGFAGQRKSGVEFVGCVGEGDRKEREREGSGVRQKFRDG